MIPGNKRRNRGAIKTVSNVIYFCRVGMWDLRFKVQMDFMKVYDDSSLLSVFPKSNISAWMKNDCMMFIILYIENVERIDNV